MKEYFIKKLFAWIIVPLFLIFTFSFLILLPGCGDVETTLSSITVTPSQVTVGVNQIQGFTAIGIDNNGLATHFTPTWSVQGNIGNINATTGFFSAGSQAATGYVIAYNGTISGQASVTVTDTCWLKGKVTNSNGGTPNGLKVYLNEDPSLFALTNSTGNYSISNIPAGTYEARIDATVYYEEISTEVTMISGESINWSPVLQIQPGAPTTISPTNTTIPSF